jgi:hypothetical protein
LKQTRTDLASAKTAEKGKKAKKKTKSNAKAKKKSPGGSAATHAPAVGHTPM